jgi:hypothetical protein
MFLFKLAEQMGTSVEWVSKNLSVAEIKGWAKYFEYKNAQAKRKQR